MFIPLHDKNALKEIHFQYVTVALILINILVFVLFQSNLVYQNNPLAAMSFALVPVEFFSEGLFTNIPTSQYDSLPVPEFWTLISYMFLHGGIWHLAGNMAFLWVFGDNVEDAMGHMNFLVFYLLCGIFAGLAHSWMYPSSTAPLIGASGAVSGIIAAYLMLHPNVKVWVLVLWRIPIPLSAGIVLGFWVLMQFAFYYLQQSGAVMSNTAWVAHIGGLIAGAVLILFMRRPGVPLFDLKGSD